MVWSEKGWTRTTIEFNGNKFDNSKINNTMTTILTPMNANKCSLSGLHQGPQLHHLQWNCSEGCGDNVDGDAKSEVKVKMIGDNNMILMSLTVSAKASGSNPAATKCVNCGAKINEIDATTKITTSIKLSMLLANFQASSSCLAFLC